MKAIIAIVVAGLASLSGAALGDDWIASRLMGSVQQQVAGKWLTVARGDTIPDGHLVRTLSGARVTLVRGTETVELAPGTQLVIHDRGAVKPFTTITQTAGTVSIEADVRNVKHFAVDTPYLAAIVKGTRFTVTAQKANSSVSVRRGHVQVESLKNHEIVILAVGQEATVGEEGGIVVSGEGKLPTVVGANGKAIGVTDKGAKGNAYGIAKQAATSGNGAGAGNGSNGNSGDNGGGNGNAKGHDK
jgi:hypothetical protein